MGETEEGEESKDKDTEKDPGPSTVVLGIPGGVLVRTVKTTDTEQVLELTGGTVQVSA